MQPIILGKPLLSDEEILAFAMSEDNRQLMTLERLHQESVRAAMASASLLLRLQATNQAPSDSLAPDSPESGSSGDSNSSH